MFSLLIPKPLFVGLLNEGGPVMYLILICFLLSLFFIVKAFVSKSNYSHSQKMISLAIDASLLALVVGCFGSVLGIIQLFDMVEAIGDVSPELFSGGLKVALLTITFGLFSFVIGRIGILIFKWTLKSEEEN